MDSEMNEWYCGSWQKRSGNVLVTYPYTALYTCTSSVCMCCECVRACVQLVDRDSFHTQVYDDAAYGLSALAVDMKGMFGQIVRGTPVEAI